MYGCMVAVLDSVDVCTPSDIFANRRASSLARTLLLFLRLVDITLR